MTNKVYNSLIKMTALTVALVSASCCCNNNPNRATTQRAVPYKSAAVKTPCPQPQSRAKRVIPPYRTDEILRFDIQTNNPLPTDCVVPNNDGTSFPIQTANPLPGNRPYYFYARPIHYYYHW